MLVMLPSPSAMPSATTVRLLLLLALFSSAGWAQSVTDVIRGRVTNDSSRVVPGATVFVTRGPDRAFKQTTTDSAGRYSITFENGTGDYLVAVSSVGLKTARRRVQRQNSERELVADFSLATDVSTLATVKVTAEKPVRASNAASPYTAETGASEKWADGVSGQLSPSMLGNLAAIAGSTPGVTQGVSGPSILGSGSESNLTTLNGLALPGGTLPRAARTDTRVTGATFDPVRGGFSGANTDIRLAQGDRNYQQRSAFLTLDAPSLQVTDAIGQSLGARYGSLRASVGADGELIRQTLTYNIALDVSQRVSDPATLFSGDARALQTAGVSGDSVSLLRTTALRLGIPVAGVGIPSNREETALTWLARFDDIRDSLNSRQITTYVSLNKAGARGFAPLSATSTAGVTTDRGIGAQFQMSNFIGDGRRVLNQTRAGVSQTRNVGNPYLDLPGASVLVRSTGSAGDGIVPLSIGGSSFFDRTESRWTGEASNLTVWNARGRRHTFKAFGWTRFDALAAEGGADLRGRFGYNSIADLSANRPATFARTLTQPSRDGTVWNSAVAMAHQWNPKRNVSLLYGARLEANGYTSSPARNTALETALGVASGVAPTTLHVSPRLGFSYTYSKNKENGGGVSMNQSGTFYRSLTGTLRGGIGEFRDLLRPDLLADASSRTGLAGSTQSVSCTGAAVPTPDWSGFLQDANTVPRSCVDGGGVLTDDAPPVTLISRSHQVPRSWRASLDWASSVGWLQVRVNNLASWDLSQASVRDENFVGVQRLALSAEAGRPVYVSGASIDPATGSVSSTESRRSAAFGRVGVLGSELRGYGAQSTLILAPDPFRLRNAPLSVYAQLSYTVQSSRRQFIGFDGTTAGDPRLREWAPSANDARQIIIAQGAFTVPKFGTVTMFARAQSGLPFTPVVQGDINGDGRSGDRAFVPSATLPLDASLATQLLALQQNGTASARRCIQTFAGRIAERNGCRGPWTATMNLQFRPQLLKRFERLTASVFVENVLAGVDQAVHGSSGLRGWGGAALPDPVLLVPRGYDASAQRFRYDANPRFGETRPSRTTLRAPFRVTLDFSMRLSTDYDLQQLRRALEPVRVARTWQPRSVDSLTAVYLRQTSNVHAALLSESDSLFLSAEQITSLRKAEAEFSARVRAIYGDLGKYLVQFAGASPTKAALDSAGAAKKAYWRVFWEQPEIAGAIVNATQRDLMPVLRDMLATPKAQRQNAQWFFGNPVRMEKAPASLAPIAPPPD